VLILSQFDLNSVATHYKPRKEICKFWKN